MLRAFRQLEIQSTSLGLFVPAEAFTGELPLTVDMHDALCFGAVALNQSELKAESWRMVQGWRNAWMVTDGAIERISAREDNDNFRTDLLIAGPASRYGGHLSIYPAVHFAQTLELLELESGPRMVTDMRGGLGFVDAEDRPIADSWLEFDVSHADFDAVMSGHIERISDFWQFVGLAVLAKHSALVAVAAKDPLKATIARLYDRELSYADVMADPSAEIVWRRSSRSLGDNGVLEACSFDVDPAIYGEGRYVVGVRNSSAPHIVKLYTEAEWAAFLGGAKDSEFDLS